MKCPPDEDKRYFYDGAAYAMAWVPGVDQRQANAYRRRQRRAKKKVRALRRVFNVSVYGGNPHVPANARS